MHLQCSSIVAWLCVSSAPLHPGLCTGQRGVAELLRVVEGGLGGGEASQGHTVRGARGVVEADGLNELDRGWVAAVLTAYAALEAGVHLAPLGHGQLHQLTHTLLVELLERVGLEDDHELVGVLGVRDALDVQRHELARVVARDPERCLGEVVGAKREVVGVPGQRVCAEGRSGLLDHRADRELDGPTRLLEHLVRRPHDETLLVLQLLLGGDEGDHDLRDHVEALGLDLQRGLEDGRHLHLGQLRVHDAEAAAAVAQHRVALLQVRPHRLQLVQRHVQHRHQRCQLFVGVGDELMEGGVEEADVDWEAVHRLKDAHEVLLLVLLEPRDGRDAGRVVLGEEHAAHVREALLLEEHVLRAAEADAFTTERAANSSIDWRVGVGADCHGAVLVGELHEDLVVLEQRRVLLLLRLVDQHLHHLRRRRRHRREEHLPGRAVHRDRVAFLDRHALGRDGKLILVDDQVAATYDAGLAHAAGHHSRV
mmetsp:Transcript_24850/g.42860  ORF Transcript_24850/g.42860 Transcript_24850/m.42860 type:complete len:481 (-) Transcript_24850:1748-3190(-)